ncbi:MAG TPA: HlyD family efflux transporter periplasmic adaptor subunit, partial [Gemmatimonadaceae bacterium]|nr:HlyD family efflux transporter periplasmic adaptor subunit [Gemmatimonadaceae bacterium]
LPWPLVSSGSVLVVPATTRVVTAADSGVISDVLVAEGERVAAGAPIIELVDYQLARDRLGINRALDSLAIAELTARASGRTASAEAMAATRRSQEALWSALERRVERLKLRAPIAGLVATVHPEDLVGRQVRPGDTLLVLSALDTIELRIALKGAGATRVRSGDVVRVVAYSNPGSPWTGRVRDVSIAALGSDGDVNGVEARARVAPNNAWRPGDSGEATIEIGRSSVFGALWWKMRQWVRPDFWL